MITITLQGITVHAIITPRKTVELFFSSYLSIVEILLKDIHAQSPAIALWPSVRDATCGTIPLNSEFMRTLPTVLKALTGHLV